jgi:hypothetical protein
MVRAQVLELCHDLEIISAWTQPGSYLSTHINIHICGVNQSFSVYETISRMHSSQASFRFLKLLYGYLIKMILQKNHYHLLFITFITNKQTTICSNNKRVSLKTFCQINHHSRNKPFSKKNRDRIFNHGVVLKYAGSGLGM